MQSFPRNRNDSVLRLVMVKFRRIRKAVSPVIAVLLMIAIAVIAAILAYMWVTGYIKFTTTKTGKAIQIQSASYTGTHLLVYVQNVGKGTVRFVAGQCLYLDGVLREKSTLTRDSLQESETVTMTDNISLYMGQTIKIKVVTDEGTSVEEYFTVSIFTGDYTLTVRIVGNGRVEPSGGAYFYDNVLLSAIPDDHWVFSGWSGDASGTANPVGIYMNESKDVTATFVAIQHQIIFYQNGVGSDFTGTVVAVDGNGYGLTDLPKSFLWDEASTHSFSFASPLTVGTDERYVWTSTSGDSAQQSDSQFVVPNGDGTVTGNYGTQFHLTVDNGGHGTGSGQDWYNTGSPATFNIGPTTVPGAAGTQYVFTGWAGSGTGSYAGTEVSYSVTMNNPITETAQWKTQYEVTFNANPSSKGTTTPSGTDWHDAGDIAISATATDTSYRFTSWTASGSITFANSSSASTTATISGSGTITADFGLNTVQITITSDPAGSGYVNVDGTPMITPYVFNWTIGETHALQASSQVLGLAGTRYVFASWSDSGAQTHDYVVPSSSETVVANYKIQYQVTFNQTGLDGTSTGTVVMIGGIGGMTRTRAELPFTDWFDNGTVYNYNAEVTSSDPNREFTLTGVTPASPITSSGTVMGSYKAWFYVTFVQSGVGPDFTDTVVTIDGLGYRASSLPVPFWWDDQSVHTFAFQSPLIVGASEQYVWASTTGLSTLQGGSLTVSASGTVTGNYQLQYQVTFAVNPSGSGTTSPPVGSNWYNAGPLSINATNNAGFTFSSWSATGSISIGNTSSASTTATINGAGILNATFTAALDHFTISSYPSSVTAGTSFSVTVTAYDSSNNVLTGYRGQVWFTSNDSKAILPYKSGNTYTFVSVDNGVHTFSGFALNTTGSETITVTDGTKSATIWITVTAATASKLVYIAGTSQSLTVGQISTIITVQRQDQYGNPTTTGSITVNLTSSSGTGRFYSDSGGTTQVTTRTISSGSSSASFYYRDSSAGSPALTASYTGLTPATTTFTINNYKLVFSDGALQTLFAGNVSAGIRVQVQDQNNNPHSPGTTITVYLTTTSPSGAFYSDSGGTTNITNVTISTSYPYRSGYFYYKDSTIGTPTLTASSTGYTPATTTFTIYSPASKLVFTSGARQTLTVGQVSAQITVQRQDQSGNPVTVGTITVNLASSSGGGVFYSDQSGQEQYQISYVRINDGSSSATFYYQDLNAGSPTLNASSTGLTSATSQFTITGQSQPLYHTTITPTSVVAGSTVTFTYRITMDSSLADLGYVNITVPQGFTGISVINVTSNVGTWHSSLSGNVITLTAYGLGDELEGSGDYVQVVFRATSPSQANTYQFPSQAYEHYDLTGSGPGTNTGTDPTVTVYIPVSITITSSPSGQGFVIVDGNAITTPTPFNWAPGSTHTLQANSPVSGGTGVQYVYTGWSDGGAQTHNYTVPSSSATITVNYKTQYNATFSQTGLDSTASGTVVTINGAAKTYSQLPNSTWVDSGTVITYSYSNVSSSTAGKRFILTSVTGPGSPITVFGPTTVTGNYRIQYQVTARYSTSDGSTPSASVVLSGTQYGSPFTLTLTTSNQTAWLDAATSWSVNTPIPASPTTERWAATSGPSGSVSGTITVNPTYYHQYSVTFAVNPSSSGTTSPPIGTNWQNATSISISAAANSGYTFSSWASNTTSITITNPSSASTTATINGPGTMTATFTVNPRNLIRNPGFEVDNSTWIESVNNLASDRADRFYANDPRGGSYDGRTDSRSPSTSGSAYASLTQNLDSTAISSVPDVTNSLTVYLYRRNTASSGTYTVEVRIYAGSYMLSYIWCTTGQLPSDTSTQKYIRIGDVSSISTSTYSSLVRNLQADWISKGLSTSLQITSIQLVSNGSRSGSSYYGQDIVWDDLQLLYLP